MPLPPGFELEQPAASEGPKLPPGFQLESAPAASPVANARDFIAGNLNKGIAGLAGLPVDVTGQAVNLGIAGYGALKGALGGTPPDLINPATQIGGSQWIENLMRKGGVVTPASDPTSKAGQYAASALQMVPSAVVGKPTPAQLPGAIAGAAASGLGAQAGRDIGGEKYAMLGGMAPGLAVQAYNAARAPSLERAQAKNQVRDETLAAAQDAGYKVIPTQIESGAGKAALESLGGKAAIKQQATIENQAITTDLARQEIGLPKDAPITMKTLEARRDQLSQPYAELASVSPNASYFLRELRDARQKATAYWREYETQKTVTSLEEYRAFNNKATAMEGKLQAEAVKVGRPELVPAMREARTAIAKTWDVERSLNLGDGNVDAQALGRLYDHGAPLTGGLETIAKFALGPGRQVTGEISKTPSPGVSKLNYIASAAMGALGSAMGPAGAAAGVAAPFVLPPAARSVVLSDAYQKNLARPDYAPAIRSPGTLEQLVRQAVIANQRK